MENNNNNNNKIMDGRCVRRMGAKGTRWIDLKSGGIRCNKTVIFVSAIHGSGDRGGRERARERR